jgi:hypothetical protein
MGTTKKEHGRMPTPALTDPDDRDSIDWDELQVDVISAPADARILVDAGPGTGKTAVACGRVAALIDDQGLAPANIWLISFTRTAVREIRNRIREYLDDPADAHSVRIATIDAQAWAIHSGFIEGASLTGSYEENIQTVTELAENHEGVFEYLDTVEHLIIDEAQDIVGVRANFICTLVKQLNSNCGVTVFSDEAQAIYGFASETDQSYKDEELLTSRLRSVGTTEFQDKSLSRIYRTDEKKLKELYTEVREQVLAPYSVTGEGKLARVTQMIRALADGENAVVDELSDSDPEGLLRTFVLFRRRVDVLNAASFWGIRPHRLRMGGLPVITESWLGVVFWDFTDKRLTRAQFEKRWADRVDRSRLTEISCEGAWRLLVQVAGESEASVSMQMLRSRLGAGVPPADFLRQDFGLGGPVFGTIHGCKGREADTVLLLLPEDRRASDGDDEEARVVFVGATRARAELRVGKGARYLKARTVRKSDRAYTLQTKGGKPSARVEVGRPGDIQADGIAGRAVFDGPRRGPEGASLADRICE